MSTPVHHTDVLIVGGGPGGTSAALSLLNYSDYRVTLVEQSDFNRTRVGEHVSASIFDLIGYLKIDKTDFEADSFHPLHASKAYWGKDQPSTTHTIFTTEEATYQLDREKFDFKLLEIAAERGATIFPRTKCMEFKQLENKNWKVFVTHPTQGKFTIHTKYLVDASGRTGSVARQVGVPSRKYDDLMGAGLFLTLDGKTTSFEQTLEAVELGWWYTACLPENKRVVTFFTDADILSKYQLHQLDAWNETLQATRHVKKLLNGAKALSEKPWVRNAQTRISNASGIDRFIAIGDAAVSYDPISSMGIGFTISSACHAARHIKNGLSHETNTTAVFQQDLTANFSQYLELRKRVYQQEKRWASSTFWKRRNHL